MMPWSLELGDRLIQNCLVDCGCEISSEIKSQQDKMDSSLGFLKSFNSEPFGLNHQHMFTMPYFQNECARQLYPYQNQFYPMNLVSPYPVAHTQDFDYFVVIDFEATCDREEIPNPQEIIEFPSVIVNSATGQLEGSFRTYVRPSFNQKLTDFCKSLTGIQQSQVDSGVSISEALRLHDEWLEAKGVKNKNFAIVTWTDWDCRVMLESECKIKKIRKPSYFNRWINLKVPFREVFHELHFNLKEAVQLAGLAWEGRAHSGLDDARNTAHLLVRLIKDGYRLSVTNSIVSESTDCALQPEKPMELQGPAFQYPNVVLDPASTRGIGCFCGVKSLVYVDSMPGPMQGKHYFGCGSWIIAGQPLCNYFALVST